MAPCARARGPRQTCWPALELRPLGPISSVVKLVTLVGLFSLALVAPAAAQEERVPPVVGGFSLSPGVFAVGSGPGTTMSYTLSEAASVYFSITAERPGLRSRRGLCWQVTKPIGRRLYRRHPARRCVALKPITTLTASGVAGPNSLAFSGRIGSRALKPGRFHVAMNAIDAAGNSSRQHRASFRVVAGST